MASREETKKMIEVMQAYVDGVDIEWKDSSTPGKWKLFSTNSRSWDWDCETYRVKPVVKPEIPWELIDEKYNYFAIDESESGDSYFYEALPVAGEFQWSRGKGAMCKNPMKINTNNCPWDQSLVGRPK